MVRTVLVAFRTAAHLIFTSSWLLLRKFPYNKAYKMDTQGSKFPPTEVGNYYFDFYFPLLQKHVDLRPTGGDLYMWQIDNVVVGW